jgi:hypothetical protein
MQLGYTSEAEWSLKQPRRCQAAKETRGPPIERAHRGGGGGEGGDTPMGVCVLRVGNLGGLRVLSNFQLWTLARSLGVDIRYRLCERQYQYARLSWGLNYRAAFIDRRSGFDLAPIPTAGSAIQAYLFKWPGSYWLDPWS